jgi:hypothetical protein
MTVSPILKSMIASWFNLLENDTKTPGLYRPGVLELYRALRFT